MGKHVIPMETDREKETDLQRSIPKQPLELVSCPCSSFAFE